MEEFEKFFTVALKALGDNGAMMVITTIFLYAAIRVLNIGLKKLSVGVEQKKHEVLVDKRNDVSREITILIERALIELNADRVVVMEYHNGTKSLGGLPFIFMSATYEAFREGFYPIQDRMTNKNTSAYYAFLSSLLEHGYVILDVNNRTNDMKAAYELVVLQEEAKSLCFSMKNLQKAGIGYVSIKKNDDFTEVDMEKGRILAEKIAIYLSMANSPGKGGK